MIKFRLILFLLFSIGHLVKAQFHIDNIALISITDAININYDIINSHTFEIKFNDSIELWNTKQLSKNEFDHKIFRGRYDDLHSDEMLMTKEKVDVDSLLRYFEKKKRAFRESLFALL